MSDGPDVITVAVDNDFPVVVEGVRAMLAAHSDRLRVVELGEAQSDGMTPDIVLKDTFAFNDDLGAYLARVVTRVVLFAASTDRAAISAALGRGAAGYVHKGVDVARLVDALVRVSAGEQVVEVDDDRSEEEVGGASWPGREHGLSERESEVLSLICQGLSNQHVALSLYLSVDSVKTYIRTLYRKIGVGSRSQAVIWGVQHGFRPAAHPG